MHAVSKTSRALRWVFWVENPSYWKRSSIIGDPMMAPLGRDCFRTIHSEYVGKTTGPETILAANHLVGRLPWGQKYQINQSVMFCIVFEQISKNLNNRS